VRERAVRSLAIGRLAGVSRGQCVDVCLLPVACRRFQRDGLLHQLERFWFVFCAHLRVDVGTKDERLAPERHRTPRIESGGLRERAASLGMVEPVREVQSLIDELLRALGLRRHLEGMGAEIQQAGSDGHARRGRLIVSWRLQIMLVRRRGWSLSHGRGHHRRGANC
jgi:hypothetical protein